MVEIDSATIVVITVTLVIALVIILFGGKSLFFTDLTKERKNQQQTDSSEANNIPKKVKSASATKSKKKKNPNKEKKAQKVIIQEQVQEYLDDQDSSDDEQSEEFRKPIVNQKKPVNQKTKKTVSISTTSPVTAVEKPVEKIVEKIVEKKVVPATVPAAFVYEEITAPVKPASDVTDDAWAIVKKPKTKKPNSFDDDEDEIVAPLIEVSPSIVASRSEPLDKVVDTVTIPPNKVGAIIGTKGATKFSIQAATGTEIALPKVSKESAEPVTATITGPAEGVKKAKKAISDLITKGFSALLEGEDFRETSFSVHNMYLPDIIGKGGANIKAIQDKLEVRVTIPQTSSTNSAANSDRKTSQKVSLSGLKDNVIKAKAIIKELILYYHTEITHPGLVHEELDISPNYYNYVIGAKGSEIKHIQANFKVSVHIPNSESINKNIVIVGPAINVDNAKKHMLKLIDNVINGVRKDSKKQPTVEDVVEEVSEEYVSRTTEVSIEELLASARHVQGVTQKSSPIPMNVSIPSQDPTSLPVVSSSPKPVPSVWVNGGAIHTNAPAAAAGSTGMPW